MYSLNTIFVGYERGNYGGIYGGNWDQLIESRSYSPRYLYIRARPFLRTQHSLFLNDYTTLVV